MDALRRQNVICGRLMQQTDGSFVDAPLLAVRHDADTMALVATGAWTAANAQEIDTAIGAAWTSAGPIRRLLVDMSAIDAFDTYGATLLGRLVGEGEKRSLQVDVTGLADRFSRLNGAVSRNAAWAGDAGAPPRPSVLTGTLEAVGRQVSAIGHDLVSLTGLFGAVCHALVGIARRPKTFRLTSTVHQFDKVAWQAVPIIALMTFLIGGIIAQQGFFHFRKFGADQYVVDMVGVLITREIGVLLVAIMVAGRSGSSYTAELGSMKMREEIDALRTMGLDPVAVLVLPRVLALIVALPALTFLGSMAALYGGGLVAWGYGGMSPDVYIARLKEAVTLTHFEVGMIKAPFMALVIALVACEEGLKVQGSAESLGLQTTASVVKSIFLVIVIDGLFAIYFASIGM